MHQSTDGPLMTAMAMCNCNFPGPVTNFLAFFAANYHSWIEPPKTAIPPSSSWNLVCMGDVTTWPGYHSHRMQFSSLLRCVQQLFANVLTQFFHYASSLWIVQTAGTSVVYVLGLYHQKLLLMRHILMTQVNLSLTTLLGGTPCAIRKVGCFPPPVATGPRVLSSAPYSPFYTRDFFFAFFFV